MKIPRAIGARLGRRLIVLGALWAASAPAQDNGVYLGAGYARPSTDYDFSFAPAPGEATDESSGFKLIGGVRPLDPLALELNYVDLGTTRQSFTLFCISPPCADRASVDARALSVSVVGLKSLPLMDLFARAGIARWEADRSVRRGLAVANRDGSDATYGVGVQFRVLSAAIRIEYERFDIAGASTELASVGFTYTFL